EIRPPFHPVLHPESAAVALDERPDDKEPEPVAAPLDPSPLKQVEDRPLQGVRYARPGILNRDQHALAVIILNPDGDLDPGTAKFDGVADQVREDLREEVVRPDLPGHTLDLDCNIRECCDLLLDDDIKVDRT